MIKKILNTGNFPENSEILNRKIRIANLIAMITIIVMFIYLPLTLYFCYPGDLILNFSFIAISLLQFFLQSRRKHYPAFYISTTFGFVYFIFASKFYGLQSNLHFFLLVMCMIVVVLFDNHLIIKGYIVLAILTFFGLLWFLHGQPGSMPLTEEMMKVQNVVTYVNLLILFIIICIFVFFFKNDNLEFQEKVLLQKEIIEEKSKDITDSITYAKRLQDAILPSQKFIEQHLPDSFILYKPKDIVAGDFYWMEKKDDLLLFAVCDCTGHGVPGAMVSVICSNALNRAIKEFNITEPGKILDKVRNLVIETFERSESEVKDGMDISLCCYNKTDNTLLWSGANNPLLLYRKGELTEFKGDKQPIGKTDNYSDFRTHNISLQKDDLIYLFTDGFSDQFGGPKGKKFKYAHLKETLSQLTSMETSNQLNLLDFTLENWKSGLEQVDDILLMGVRF
ncbi:MAG: SpoIIE family protein phosphatase [Bacteroidota bacterium]|nr:SpoIIE family protein phosphatase [Bacteroidota bacterium]